MRLLYARFLHELKTYIGHVCQHHYMIFNLRNVINVYGKPISYGITRLHETYRQTNFGKLMICFLCGAIVIVFTYIVYNIINNHFTCC